MFSVTLSGDKSCLRVEAAGTRAYKFVLKIDHESLSGKIYSIYKLYCMKLMLTHMGGCMRLSFRCAGKDSVPPAVWRP